MKQKIVVLYHGDCPDGFGAAWAARKKFGSRAVYLPLHYDDLIPPEVKGAEVYLLDFGIHERELEAIIKQAGSFVFVDHHESSKALLHLIENKIFDTKHSGSALAWRYFNPSKPLPKLLRYVEMRDLWKFKTERDYWIAAALELLPHDFRAWDVAERDFKNALSFKKILGEGRVLRQKTLSQVQDLLKRVSDGIFENLSVGILNSSLLQDQAGNEIVKRGYDAALIWYATEEGVKVSLRGQGRANLAEISSRYGGGGHPNASGFRLKEGQVFPWQYTHQPLLWEKK